MIKNSFEIFAEAVRASVEQHAERKGYTDHGQVADYLNKLGIHRGHAIGEIICKSVEYLKTPRRVILEKIAGWAFLLWERTDEE